MMIGKYKLWNSFVTVVLDGGGSKQAVLALSERSWCLWSFVKQARHPESARRAFYVCQLKRRPPTLCLSRGMQLLRVD
jgi:hypothetical protein